MRRPSHPRDRIGAGPRGLSWSFLETFRAPIDVETETANWAGATDLAGTARKVADEARAVVDRLLARSEQLMAEIGRDPSRSDWSRFRPLRLQREEDWSDWLAFLIETSSSGFGTFLLGRAHSEERPFVVREDTAADVGRRGDLTIFWSSTDASSLEVKLWDDGFLKTEVTAAGLETKHPTVRSWTHHILLPAEQVADFDAECGPDSQIRVLVWDDMAVSIRRSLVAKQEGVVWRSFASAFCGAIEQTLLGIKLTRDRGMSLPSVERFIRILEAVHGQSEA